MAQFESGINVYVADVDGTATGATAIFTAPQGFGISQIQIVSTGISGLLFAPTISVGTNSSSYNNIITLSALTLLTATGDTINTHPLNPCYIPQTNDTIYCNVTTAALATSYNFQLVVIGYPI